MTKDYANIGASKQLQRRHGSDTFIEAKHLKKVIDATERLESRSNDPKYSNKQRAKDYDTAIRNLSVLRDRQYTQAIDDDRYMQLDKRRLNKLDNKQMTDKRRAKIDKLVTDSKLMELRITQAGDKYEKYNDLANKLVKTMANDSAVVYSTRRRTHAYSTALNDQYYSISNTDYKVRANNKRRSKSKKYNSPDRKKEYENRLIKTAMIYY